MKSLVDEIKKGKVLVSDGAWGTFLFELGLENGDCPEIWNVTRRNDVLKVAKSYIDAGSDMILTNSFGGHPIKLDHYGFKDSTFEINKAAAEISREAAGEDKFVLGSMGPTGVVLMMGEVPEEEVYEGFCLQAKALAAGGADAILVETMMELQEGVLAIKAAKASTDLEVISTFFFDKTVHGYYRTMMGVSPEQMVQAVKEAGADIIGANCGVGMDQMIEVVQAIREEDSTTPILVHTNAGMPVIKDGKTVYPESPEEMAGKVKKLVECGANVIGGCCGTTPDHIRAFIKAIK